MKINRKIFDKVNCLRSDFNYKVKKEILSRTADKIWFGLHNEVSGFSSTDMCAFNVRFDVRGVVALKSNKIR